MIVCDVGPRDGLQNEKQMVPAVVRQTVNASVWTLSRNQSVGDKARNPTAAVAGSFPNSA